MNNSFYFKLLKLYSDIWARTHCRVVLSGEHHLQNNQNRRRIYIVSHPTTYDLPMLVHIARNSFYVVVYKDPFKHPIAGWLFRNIGFPKLDSENADQMIEESSRLIRQNHPLVYSLKGYGVDFGEDVKPRTGGIRIAYGAQADIYPIHLMIEPNNMIFKYYKNRKGEVFPYTIFKDTLYFATFCKPLRYEDYAKDTMDYEAFRKIAYQIESEFQRIQGHLEQELVNKAELHGGGKRKRGGSPKQVLF
jgi:1-acyl-sn-glycerol-3-phosphate acyltransferase